jgi:glycosyltransferase involved in cell wall biosynthesis
MPKLSVLIPIYNEKDTLRELMRRVQEAPVDKEIILIDDFSTDGSREIIRREIDGRSPHVKVVYHEKNFGKGYAIRSGLKEAEGDIVIIQDADLEYDPVDYAAMCRPFDEDNAKVVYGTRFKHFSKRQFLKQWIQNCFGSRNEIKRFHHFFGVHLLNALANGLYGAGITDEATCYKAFRRDVLNSITLRCTGFEFCPEVTAKLRKAGHRIVEVPISYHPRTEVAGKKLNWRHGIEAISTLIKYRFVD